VVISSGTTPKYYIFSVDTTSGTRIQLLATTTLGKSGCPAPTFAMAGTKYWYYKDANNVYTYLGRKA